MCLDMHTNNSDDAVTDHTRGAPSVESSDMDIDISHPAASHIRTSTVDTEQDAATSNQPADADKGYSAVRQHHKSVPESICQDGTRAEKRLHVWTAKSGVVRTYESPIPRERLTKKMKKRIRKRWNDDRLAQRKERAALRAFAGVPDQEYIIDADPPWKQKKKRKAQQKAWLAGQSAGTARKPAKQQQPARQQQPAKQQQQRPDRPVKAFRTPPSAAPPHASLPAAFTAVPAVPCATFLGPSSAREERAASESLHRPTSVLHQPSREPSNPPRNAHSPVRGPAIFLDAPVRPSRGCSRRPGSPSSPSCKTHSAFQSSTSPRTIPRDPPHDLPHGLPHDPPQRQAVDLPHGDLSHPRESVRDIACSEPLPPMLSAQAHTPHLDNPRVLLPHPREPGSYFRDPVPVPRHPSPYPGDPLPYPRDPMRDFRDPLPYPRDPAPYPRDPLPYPRDPAPYPRDPLLHPRDPVPYPRDLSPYPRDRPLYRRPPSPRYRDPAPYPRDLLSYPRDHSPHLRDPEPDFGDPWGYPRRAMPCARDRDDRPPVPLFS